MTQVHLIAARSAILAGRIEAAKQHLRDDLKACRQHGHTASVGKVLYACKMLNKVEPAELALAA
jgi:hypothetical protein